MFQEVEFRRRTKMKCRCHHLQQVRLGDKVLGMTIMFILTRIFHQPTEPLCKKIYQTKKKAENHSLIILGSAFESPVFDRRSIPVVGSLAFRFASPELFNSLLLNFCVEL